VRLDESSDATIEFNEENKTILVIGATGVIGFAVVQHLLGSTKYKVKAMTRDPTQKRARDLEKMGAEVVQADIMNFHRLLDVMEGCFGVFSIQQYVPSSPHLEFAQGLLLPLFLLSFFSLLFSL